MYDSPMFWIGMVIVVIGIICAIDEALMPSSMYPIDEQYGG